MMPPQVYPPILKRGKVSIEFFILKDGKVSGMQVHTSSGYVALDRAAWASITASTPFPPLPKEFLGQKLGLRFYYFYNLQPPGISISISPSTDVRVPVGSTLQFSASGNGIIDTSVTWSVSGSSCSNSACGTISNTGLYTAPVNIPSPPTVIVEATSRTFASSADAKLTVVQANPSH
jgi:TonB family protein